MKRITGSHHIYENPEKAFALTLLTSAITLSLST
ncbi:MAG: hypothetical protein WBV73_28010 [Phormidium sp.]